MQILRPGIHRVGNGTPVGYLPGQEGCYGAEETCQYVQLLIYGTDNPDYWLIVDARDTSKLRTLDRFLRDIWLECCGHLSAFTIGGVRYEVEPDNDFIGGLPTKSMNVTLKTAFGGVKTASYEYDFGSTTDLTIEVQGWHTGKCLKKPITVLSRNIPPVIECCECGKPAEWIDPERMWDDPDEAVYCSECLKKAAYEEEDLDEEDLDEEDISYVFEECLPACNSPRCGVCAYEGSTKYPDAFVPDKRSSKKKTTRKGA